MSIKIEVQVKTRSSIEKVEVISNQKYIVRVNTPPVDGKANLRVIELLSVYFKVSKSKIQLISGPKSKKKIFEVDN